MEVGGVSGGAIVGTNRRYAVQVDQRMDERIVQQLAAKSELQTLLPIELQLDALALTIDPHPKPIRAWVRFGETPVQVLAEACRWTSKAVGIRFRAGGKEYHAWVWASAVEEDLAARRIGGKYEPVTR